MNPTVVALLVSHDGARWLPAVIDGLPRPDRPRRPASSRSTPAAATRAPTCCSTPSTRSSRCSGRDGVPRRGARRPRAGPAPSAGASGSGCSTTTATPRPTRSSGCSPRPRPTPTADVLGPKLREWPSLQAAARGRRHDLRHRPARDRARAPASTTRASTTRCAQVLAVNTAGMLVRRPVLDELGGLDDNLPMFGNDLDFGWRAAAAGAPDRRRAPGRRLPRRGRPPRRPPYAADRPAHPLPGAPGRAVHAAGQRAGAARCRWQVGPALLRHPAADDRVPGGPLAPARRSTSWRRCFSVYVQPRRDPRAPAGRARTPVRRPHDVRAAAGAVVGALPARPRLRRRHRRRRDQPGPGRRRPAPRRRRRPAAPGAAPPAGRRTDDDDAVAEDTGLVARFFTNPLARRAQRWSWCSRSSAPARRSATVTGGGLAPAPATRRRPVAAVDRVVAPARHGHRACRRRRTSLPLAVLGSRARRQRRGRGLGACCCSPCRWRCGVPGGCSAWSAGWSTPAARRAGWSRSARSPTPWCR